MPNTLEIDKNVLQQEIVRPRSCHSFYKFLPSSKEN